MSDVEVDVAVVGGTAGGVCAAVAAASRGCSVVLLEAGGHLGGMTSGGLGWTDVGDERVLGGYAARFRAAVADHYGVPVGRYAGPEPRVAEAILTRWLEGARVDVRLGVRLAGATVIDGRLTAVAVEPTAGRTGTGAAPTASGSGGVVSAHVWIDATYEGDLLAAAGCTWAVGREDSALHGEFLAGRQELLPGRHVMPFGISPFAEDESGRRAGPVLPGIRDVPSVPVGAGDGGVMGYGYRVCLSQEPDRVPVTERPGYDPADFELARRLLRHYERTGFDHTAGWWLGLTPNLPRGRVDANSLGPFSLSLLDGSAWEYPTAGPDRREELRLRHLHHAQDFLWFLARDPAVPRRVRDEVRTWGLPADEFADTGHWPHQLYVREARRLQGEVVLTQGDLQGPTRWPDVVAMGSYHIDIREVQRTWRWAREHPDPIAHVVTEGYLSVAVPPYGIPYRALLPRREECTNLLVPVCVSSSAVAFASIRMEPQYQLLGHAAGVGAALAVRDGVEVHEVGVAALQEALHADGQVLA